MDNGQVDGQWSMANGRDDQWPSSDGQVLWPTYREYPNLVRTKK